MQKKLVIYHADCTDGFTAAWAAWVSKDWHDAEFIAARYGDPPPDVFGRHVLIVDFSFPRAVLEDMHAVAASLRVLDHHKTAQADLEGLDYATFDMTKSGAMLAWEFCNPGPATPALVRYVQDRDLWEFKLPMSREVSALISTVKKEFRLWSELAQLISATERSGEEARIVFAQGAVVLRSTERYVEETRTRARMVDVVGYSVPCINSTYALSELVGELAEGHPFAVGWFERQDGSFQYSLRSRGSQGIDVSEVARKFGGGGHRNASGFELRWAPTRRSILTPAQVAELIDPSHFAQDTREPRPSDYVVVDVKPRAIEDRSSVKLLKETNEA